MPDPIEHVIVLMLENQSFDRVLGDLKSVNPAVDGVDPARPGSNADPDGGQPYTQMPGAPNATANDLGHDLDDVQRQIANNCAGFIADYATKQPNSGRAERQQVISYFEHGRLPALHALAENFLVCDRWFSSVPGPTWPNRFFVHSGTSLGHTDMPEGYDPALHIYSQPTVYERLAEANVPWRIYVGDFSQTAVMTAQWKYLASNYATMTQFYTDVAGDPAVFPAYSFIEPSFFGARQNDQHPPYDILLGEQLIGRVYNALRANAALWATTLFVVLYDEHGGFYDHVDPQTADPGHRLAIPPDDQPSNFAFDRFGVRVPAVLVSPWIDAGVDHTVFDHTSLIKYAIDKWSLGPLGRRAAAANSIAPLLGRRQAARGDAPASVPLPVAAVAGPSAGLNRNQSALLAFSQFAEAHLVPVPAEIVADRIRRSFLGTEPLAHVMAERALDLMKSGSP
jgi:phospholipase C